MESKQGEIFGENSHVLKLEGCESGQNSTEGLKTAGGISEPVFLVGSIRSGTTLLRLMLDSHPELAFFHEFQYVVEALPEVGWPDLRWYYEFLRGHRIFQDSAVVVDPTLDYPELADSFLRQKRDRDGKRLVGATVHVHFDRLTRIWPDARFIHLLRDGRDVARSQVDLGWVGNVYTGVRSWIEAERTWERVRAEVPASRRLEMKYESLVLDPEGELGRACEFLGLEYDPAMLRYDEHSTYERPDVRLIAQWKRKLPRRAVRLAESRISDMLVERGYELSGYKPLRVGRMGERLIRAGDRWNRLRSRHQKEGTALFACELGVRALEPVYRALVQFREHVRGRLQEVERSLLK